MRIAVDARELAGRPTGVGRYLSELIAWWSRDTTAGDAHITLVAPQPLLLPADLVGAGGARVDTTVAHGGSGTRWEQFTLPRALARDIDVLFCPGYSAPILARTPFVVAIHDVSFFAHPEWFGLREGLRRRWTVRASARRAARVVTISAFSRDEIVRHIGVPAERIEVTWLAPWSRAGAETGAPPPGSGLPRAEAGGQGPTLLFAGSILNRRQIPLLVRAFAPVARSRTRVRLVIVGENRTHPREDPAALARELGIAGAVDVREYVPDAVLAALYRDASAFVWLSTYEGFGLPPLEAMAAGLPVVACDTAVAREVYGDAARYVPEGDAAALTAAIGDVLGNPAERTRLCEAAGRVLTRYCWERTAQTTLDVLRRAARARA